MSAPRRATYRLQLGPDLDFAAAADLVAHLAALGVSHLYLSPIAQAVPGSTHGYDVVDPGEVSRALGGEDELRALAAEARTGGLGLLLDVVPNHVAAHADNARWWSLLRDGRDGDGARWFDVDWDQADGRVVVPVLGGPLDEVVAAGDLVRRGGELRYFDHRFPIAPGTTGGDEDATVDVASLLARQHYRLAWWREPGNYRRFFDIGDLAGLRVEDPEVFAAAHALPARLVHDRTVDGVRVDHVDGLRDPTGYLRALRALLGPEAWILVEKILGPGERLPAAWQVEGTTGYEWADAIGAALVDAKGAAALLDGYRDFTSDRAPWLGAVTTAKADVLDQLFPADLDRVVRSAAAALGPDAGLRPRLRSFAVALDVYRTYVGPGDRAGADDVARIDAAIARVRGGFDAAPTWRALRDLLTGRRGGAAAEEARLAFQQLTGPVTAKGVEDTAMYRWVPLLARNEVGSAPGHLARSVASVHAHHATARPQGLLTLSTHDGKRSGDVRARLSVLAEIPTAWNAAVTRWSDAAEAYRSPVGPDPRTEWLAWQTMAGAWPVDADRLRAVLRKSVREAKLRTSWLDPDGGFEAACDGWVDGVLGDDALVDDVDRFVREHLLVPGRVLALTQTLVALTAPGVPDFYQGSELWQLALVDPDNRRPVDHDRSAALLQGLGPGAPTVALADPDDPGRPKLWLVSRALDLRRVHPEWFDAEAGYEPLAAPDTVVAFARAGFAVTVAPLRTTPFPVADPDATVTLPSGRWRDVLDDRVHPGGGPVPLGALLDGFPVALLVPAG